MVWGQEFNSQQQAIRVTYVSTSSAEGIRGIARHEGDFAIGEIPLTREQLRDPNLKLAQIPIAVVSVVPIYNLPGKPQMRFTGELLAQIYLGDVSNWNDRRIAMLNPGIAFPNLPIVVVQRPGGTGTRYIWTEFLSQSMPEFRSRTTGTKQRNWGEITASKSKDLVAHVAATPGAIGYVERSFAASSGLAYGDVQNRSGKFVWANGTTIRAAFKAKGNPSSDFSPPLANAEADDAYPLVSFAWVYIPASGLDTERKSALRLFLEWSLQYGQLRMNDLNYLPLPDDVANRARVKLRIVLQ